MADILDAAQQQINAAAGGPPPAGDVPAPDPVKPVDPVSPATPAETPKTETPPAEPAKPVDDLPLPPEKPLVVPATGPVPALDTPTPTTPAPVAPTTTPEPQTAASETSVATPTVSSAPPPEPPPPAPVAPSSSSPKKSGKGGSKIAIIAGVIMLLFSLPLGVFFVSQQQQLADNRSSASTCQPGEWSCNGACADQGTQNLFNGTWGAGGKDHWMQEAGCGGGGGGGGNDGGGGNNDDDGDGCNGTGFACDGLGADASCVQLGGRKAAWGGCVNKTVSLGKCPNSCGNASTGGGGDGGGNNDGGGGGNGGGDEDDGEIVNPGTNDNSCNNNTGSCTAGGDQNLIVCYCEPHELVTEQQARDAGKYPEAVGSCPLCETKPGGSSSSCKQEAKNSCKIVQLDIVSPDDPQKIIDTIVCNPPANCSTGQGGGGGGTTSGGGGGGGKEKEKKKLSCQKLRIFKAGKKVDEKDWPKLKVGDAIQFVVDHQQAKRARVRVNGAAWTETTKKKDGDFIVDFTMPAGVTTFTIEAEVNKKGNEWK